MRTKYQYRTRQAAEDAARACDDRAFLNGIAFNAALDGSIRWIGCEGRFGEAGSYYRFGCIPRIAETVVVVQFLCPSTGQKPHAAAYHETWLQEEIARFTVVAPTDKLGMGYRAGLYALRDMLYELHKQEAA